eukprot:GHRR01028363.1.p2 GENE.GHRR01028363.1~~GHRR01028363.1.p2  ORF type:complete len:126 (+),score=19.43 GHRR01028363.1:1437-1814(+)
MLSTYMKHSGVNFGWLVQANNTILVHGVCGAGLLAGAKKYRDALAAMSEAQQSFAAALHDFGCGGDEESLLIGSAVMSQFVKAFRELSYAYSFVQDCVSAARHRFCMRRGAHVFSFVMHDLCTCC